MAVNVRGFFVLTVKNKYLSPNHTTTNGLDIPLLEIPKFDPKGEI